MFNQKTFQIQKLNRRKYVYVYVVHTNVCHAPDKHVYTAFIEAI